MRRSMCWAALCLALGAAPALAATAFNSQAGAYGGRKNVCGATAYFPAGGCASDAFDPGLAGERPPYAVRGGQPRRDLTLPPPDDDDGW